MYISIHRIASVKVTESHHDAKNNVYVRDIILTDAEGAETSITLFADDAIKLAVTSVADKFAA